MKNHLTHNAFGQLYPKHAFTSMTASNDQEEETGGIVLPKMLQGCLLPSCGSLADDMVKPQKQKPYSSRYVKSFWKDYTNTKSAALAPNDLIISVPTSMTKSSSFSSESSPYSTTSPISTDSALNSVLTSKAEPNYSPSNGKSKDKDTQQLAPAPATGKNDPNVNGIDDSNNNEGEKWSNDDDNDKENDIALQKEVMRKNNDSNNDDMTILRSNTSSSSAQQKQAMRCHSISNKLNCAEGQCGSGHESETKLCNNESSLMNPLSSAKSWLKKTHLEKDEGNNEKTREIIGKPSVVTGLKRSKGSKQHRVLTPKEHARKNLNSKVIYSKTRINWGNTPPKARRGSNRNYLEKSEQ